MGTGIGKAITKALAKDSARVAIVSRIPSHLETTKATLQGMDQIAATQGISVEEFIKHALETVPIKKFLEP